MKWTREVGNTSARRFSLRTRAQIQERIFDATASNARSHAAGSQARDEGSPDDERAGPHRRFASRSPNASPAADRLPDPHRSGRFLGDPAHPEPREPSPAHPTRPRVSPPRARTRDRRMGRPVARREPQRSRHRSHHRCVRTAGRIRSRCPRRRPPLEVRAAVDRGLACGSPRRPRPAHLRDREVTATRPTPFTVPRRRSARSRVRPRCRGSWGR